MKTGSRGRQWAWLWTLVTESISCQCSNVYLGCQWTKLTNSSLTHLLKKRQCHWHPSPEMYLCGLLGRNAWLCVFVCLYCHWCVCASEITQKRSKSGRVAEVTLMAYGSLKAQRSSQRLSREFLRHDVLMQFWYFRSRQLCIPVMRTRTF